MNPRVLALAALALGAALLVFSALRALGTRDPEPRTPSPEERGGQSTAQGVDALAGILLRPGPLSRAHAHLEGAGRCTLCHGRAHHVPDARCETCHEQIALRAARALPLHGSFEGSCAGCHTEHAGLASDLIDLDRDSFAHGRTRFALQGAHAALDCDACHLLGRGDGAAPAFAYQGVPFASCRSCHSDPHSGGIAADGKIATLMRVDLDPPAAAAPLPDPEHPLTGRDCADCHGQTSFDHSGLRPDGFDHDRDTRFPLRGAHARASCTACHPAEQQRREQIERLAPGRAAQPVCGSCHRDPHRGALGDGKKCQRCHGTERWSKGFDHGADTRFALDELHAAQRCESCHTDQRYRAEGRTCEACHAGAADLLAGRSGSKQTDPDPHHEALACKDCHGPTRASNRPPALAARCASCHDASYAPLLATWRARLDEAAADARGDAAQIEHLRRSGPHHFALAYERLRALASPKE